MSKTRTSAGAWPRSIQLLLLAWWALAGVATAQGGAAEQGGGGEEPATVAEESLTASDQGVDVLGASDDSAIERRIREILEATGAFRDPRVEVRNGVVFLSGTADSETRVEWAKALAGRTEDVVAVVNELEVPEAPIWDFQPAVDELKALGREAVRGLPLLVLGLFVLAVTLAVSRGVSRALVRVFASRIESGILRSVLEKALYVGVLLLGTYVFLRISGLTRVAVTLVGGTGIAGLVLGFAFRDIAENFLASLLISLQRPFRIGDTITVGDHTGVVQRVTTRGTILMDFDGNHIQIANANVYKSTILNMTANPKVRISFTIGIGYDARISESQTILHDVMEGHSAVLADPHPRVLVDELGASTVNLRLYAWIDGHEHSKVRVQSSLMRLSLRALSEAGVSMPDEAREVVFPDGVPIVSLPGRGAAPERSEPGAGDAQAQAVPTEGLQVLRRRASAEGESRDETTEAEGDLSAESVEIDEQARQSGSPEASADVLS